MPRLGISILLLSLSVAVPRQASTQNPAPAEISADLGPCSALLTVTEDAKPVYGARVTTRVQYGFMGVKKLDLEAFTGVDGTVKITHLPESLKKPMILHIEKHGKGDQVDFKPADNCHATFNVQLK